MSIHSSAQIHYTAIIDDGAEVGAGCRIWHWVHICSTAEIGRDCSLGQNVYVGRGVRIGNNVKIQNNVSVYDAVILEDSVFCGPSVVFTNVINPRSAIVRKDEYRATFVEKGASLGANSTIICGNRIGSYAFVAAGALVTKDVKPFALVMGVPAKQVGWWSAWGEKIDLPLCGDGDWTCPHTGNLYTLKDKILVCDWKKIQK